MLTTMENTDDLREAQRLEDLGDAAAAAGKPATGSYRQAQKLLMPDGVVFTDREAHDRRMQAFDRIQQKIYALQDAESRPPELSVWHFFPGLVVRVVQPFRDYDGQQIDAGEILHLLDRSYFPYEGGHTLRFVEKTVRLADIVDEHVPIINNARNAWFEPMNNSA